MSCPKVKRIKDAGALEKARQRDGYCLWGLYAKDGCIGQLGVHHIETRGSGGDDVPENLIVLCQKHHNQAHARTITVDQLRALLKKVYAIPTSE